MADTSKQISAKLARELSRDGNTDRLNTDPRAVDELNKSVIEEFRANQVGSVVPWRFGTSCCLR